MKPKIIKKGEAIKLAGFSYQYGKIKTALINLAGYAGRFVRVWLDTDGSLSLDSRKGHFWQIAEFQVPDRKYKEVPGKDPATGEDIINLEPLPLDLKDMTITVFELPE